MPFRSVPDTTADGEKKKLRTSHPCTFPQIIYNVTYRKKIKRRRRRHLIFNDMLTRKAGVRSTYTAKRCAFRVWGNQKEREKHVHREAVCFSSLGQPKRKGKARTPRSGVLFEFGATQKKGKSTYTAKRCAFRVSCSLKRKIEKSERSDEYNQYLS